MISPLNSHDFDLDRDFPEKRLSIRGTDIPGRHVEKKKKKKKKKKWDGFRGWFWVTSGVISWAISGVSGVISGVRVSPVKW